MHGLGNQLPENQADAALRNAAHQLPCRQPVSLVGSVQVEHTNAGDLPGSAPKRLACFYIFSGLWARWENCLKARLYPSQYKAVTLLIVLV